MEITAYIDTYLFNLIPYIAISKVDICIGWMVFNIMLSWYKDKDEDYI